MTGRGNQQLSAGHKKTSTVLDPGPAEPEQRRGDFWGAVARGWRRPSWYRFVPTSHPPGSFTCAALLQEENRRETSHRRGHRSGNVFRDEEFFP